jgi:glutathione peroxidase
MKNLFTFIAVSFLSLSLTAQFATFHDYSAATIDHDTISMSQFYGKKVMVVNTATYCSYTYQYANLESLYTNYKQYGFEIVGFPCNDFANQDPHGDSAINAFCTGTYNVTFQMMSKVKTIANPVHPIYQWLKSASLNGVSNASVSWNFNKFLIDEAGHWVKHYTQSTEPDDPAIIAWIVDTPSVVQSTGIIEKRNGNLATMRSANPGSSVQLTFNNALQHADVAVYNLNGQLLKTIYNGTATANQAVNADVADLPQGVYLVKITGTGASQTLKFVR